MKLEKHLQNPFDNVSSHSKKYVYEELVKMDLKCLIKNKKHKDTH